MKDGRQSPQEVLGWLTGVRYRPEDLERAFFSARFTRKLDALEYRGEPLSRYDVGYVRGTDRFEEVGRPRLYETPHAPRQPKLFRLDALGETGWLKALKLEGYASRHPRRSLALQEALFPYLGALA
jgi:hypothetical protein